MLFWNDIRKVGLALAMGSNSPDADVPFTTFVDKTTGITIPIPPEYKPIIDGGEDSDNTNQIDSSIGSRTNIHRTSNRSFRVLGKLVRDRLSVLQNNKSLA